jgi:hypothetical protein
VAFRAKDQVAQSIVARSGIGLALLPHYIGRCDPLLRACGLGSAPSSRDIFLLIRTRDLNNTSICIVADEIGAIFKQERKLFD